VSPTPIVNFSRNRRQELTDLVEAALRGKLFPGMELLVARGDELLLHEAWGMLEVGPEAQPMAPGTVFDIASVTKPVATATLLLVLLEQGKLSLEDKVCDSFPEFDTPEKRGITLRHLLTHTAGLPAWGDFYSKTKGAAEALHALLHTPLQHPTGTAMLYSDLGYLILAELIRRTTGRTLGEAFQHTLGHPLRLTRTAFNPLAQDMPGPYAPTQYCPWRQQLLRGVVHDENAFVFQGEGGNAGLFSTAADLWRYARMILGGGELEGVRVLSTRTVARMTANHNPRRLPPRGLGWDIKGEGFGYMSCGELLAPGSIGHTGFTGTSIWMEPESGFTVILLTNRVHMARERNQPEMIRFRPRLHNLVVSLLGG
jgi:CubicO group peptidase (beta-lactamase class C family)